MPAEWRPPDLERSLGIGFYASATPGIGGRLKTRPEEFRVTELSRYPVPDPAGAYTVLRIASRNWEQHELSLRIAQRLGLPPHALAWAGTKDRRAVAERLASYKGRPPERLDLPGVELLESYIARDGLSLGHHYGNAFAIRIGEVDPSATLPQLGDTRAALRAARGIPNFFGPQRFGEVRPITHRVGARLVRGDVAGAVDLYLTDRTGPPPERGDSARAEYARSHDATAALRAYPPEYKFERILLDHLARGHPPDRALRGLSRPLRTLFVHAYQGWLFNRYLTARAARGLPFDSPVGGDHVLRIGVDGTPTGADPVPVTDDNLEEVRATVARGRAVVAGPLVGSATPPSRGAPGELLEAVLAEEGVERAMFDLPAVPDLASDGAWRPVQLAVPPIAWHLDPGPTPGTGETGVWLEFGLPKGAYATVVLREFQKLGATSIEAPDASDPSSKRAY